MKAQLKNRLHGFRAQSLPMQLFTLALGVGIAVQFLYLCWVCMTQWPNHLDGDSSTQILKVMEIAKNGSFSLRNWNDTTTLLLDMPLTLAALLMPLFGDAFAAYGAADIVVDLLLCIGVYQILRCAGCPLWAWELALLLLLCPYERGTGLSYANCVLVQSSYYSVRVLYFLYLLWGMLLLVKGRRTPVTVVVCLFTLGLSLLVGVSSGIFMLLLITLPVLLFWALNLLASRQYNRLKHPAFLLPLLSLLCVVAGCWVQRNVIHFRSRDSVVCWIGYDAFFKNFGSVIQGYFKLMGGMPFGSDVSILSLDGICYAAGYAVALVLPFGAAWCLVQALRNKDTAGQDLTAAGLLRGCCLMVVGFDLFIFLSSALAYGESTYEVRYLIFMVVAMVLLLASCLPELKGFGDVPVAFVGAFLVCALLNLVSSDVSYLNPTYDFSYAQAVTQAIGEAYPEAKVVYMFTDDHDRKVLRVADESKVYRMISPGGSDPGDYTYYSDGQGLEEGTVLLCTQAQYNAMPESIRSRYTDSGMPGYWLYLDMTGYSTNDPQPYFIYHCPDGGIDLTSYSYD